MRNFRLHRHATKYVRLKHSHWLRLKEHPIIVPLTTLLVLLVITAVGFVFFRSQTIGANDSHVVILTYDKKQQAIPTRAAKVGDLLKRLKIQLNSGDVVEPGLNTNIVE